MVIEQFQKEHLDGVVTLEHVCFSHPWRREDLAAQIESPTSHFLVAVADGTVAGYLGVQLFGGEGYVTNVAVLPQYRRQRIAQALLQEALKNEMAFLTLEVRESNAAAIALYEKLGFQRLGVRPHFYTDPDEGAVIMTKYKEPV